MNKLYKAFIIILGLIIHSTVYSEPLTLSSSKQQTTLIELFTSEGCSSCPPAERWLNKLKDDSRLWKQIIPLAFHVDYWDYIGWKDSFATPANTERQRRYHQERGISTVYTPGFVNNGKEWRQWFGLKTLTASPNTPGQLKASIADNQLEATFASGIIANDSLKLNIAILGFGFTTKIKAGENAGRISAHDFVVIGQTSQNSFNGQWHISLPDTQQFQAKRKAIAIWVSQTDRQQPIQAVGGWLN